LTSDETRPLQNFEQSDAGMPKFKYR
jgi:hypothetical protein